MQSRRAHHRVSIPAVVVGALCLLSACTVGGPSGQKPIDTPEPAPAYLAVATSAGDIQLLAGIRGTLGLTADRCFAVVAADGTAIPAIFPVGTTALAGDDGVTVPGVGDIVLGDEIDGGGGSGPSSIFRENADIPPACEADEIFLLTIDESPASSV